ncbi:MAG: SIS domain-containing protein [Cellvibrio sp.]|uniref:SIS domain-containing protein n=1 Tax=Cellvibrio sp. TaxID=1965322 RepID=UPI0031A46572
MLNYLNYSESALKEKGAFWTAKEITQQPDAWLETSKIVDANNEQLSAWLKPLLAKNNLRIILTGAGTSAYIGDTLAPHLTKENKRQFESISTTNIVSNPDLYLVKEIPTLMVSYGRSGSSPESIATIDLANQIIDECYHLIITCNPEGVLSLRCAQEANAFVLLMPLRTHDQSFAMTSSFSSMYVATLCVFAPAAQQLEEVARIAKHLLTDHVTEIQRQATSSVSRLIFLGSGCLKGIAQEASLKCLELTSGQVPSFFESPLGFRHGPKTLVNEDTEIIIFMSQAGYTSGYEKDLLVELNANNKARNLLALDIEALGGRASLSDVWAGLPYVVYCQMMAFYKSVNLGISPDNPSPSGEVNRVVKGVNIYPFVKDSSAA